MAFGRQGFDEISAHKPFFINRWHFIDFYLYRNNVTIIYSGNTKILNCLFAVFMCGITRNARNTQFSIHIEICLSPGNSFQQAVTPTEAFNQITTIAGQVSF